MYIFLSVKLVMVEGTITWKAANLRFAQSIYIYHIHLYMIIHLYTFIQMYTYKFVYTHMYVYIHIYLSV